MSINIWEIDGAINLAPTVYSLNLNHIFESESADREVYSYIGESGVLWGLQGNDYIRPTTGSNTLIQIGGTGDDYYSSSINDGTIIVIEPKFSGTEDAIGTSYAIESFYGSTYHIEYPSYYGYVNNEHVFFYKDDTNGNPHTLIVDALIDHGFEEIQLFGYDYGPSIFQELQNR